MHIFRPKDAIARGPQRLSYGRQDLGRRPSCGSQANYQSFCVTVCHQQTMRVCVSLLHCVLLANYESLFKVYPPPLTPTPSP